MKFVKGRTAIYGIKNVDRGMIYVGKEPVRLILGPCLSILFSSLQKGVIGTSHIYPAPLNNDQYGPYNHPENIVASYLKHIKQLNIRDANFWITDREKTTRQGKELIMRSIDAVVQAGHKPILLNDFPTRCTLTTNPEQMLVEVYDITSHE